MEKYKAWFVAWGFSQVEGVDYDETLAPVARYTSIRSLISIALEMGWKIHQMDVKTVHFSMESFRRRFMLSSLRALRFMRESHVCRLKKALYGLKQPPQAWYSRIDSYLLSMSF